MSKSTLVALLIIVMANLQSNEAQTIGTLIDNVIGAVNPFNNTSFISPANPNSVFSFFNPSSPNSFLNPNSTNFPPNVINNAIQFFRPRNRTSTTVTARRRRDLSF